MKKKIEIWGSLPEPYGGVSVHLLRLIYNLKDNDNIKMLSFKSKQLVYFTPQIKIPTSLFSELIRIIFSKNFIHLHSNNFYLILLLGYLLRGRMILTLHNKQVCLISSSKQKMMLSSLKRMNTIFANDDEVIKLLKDNQVNCIKNSAYLKPTPIENSELPSEFINILNKNFKIYSLSLSNLRYKDSDVYGVKKLIKILENIDYKEDIKFVLCLNTVDTSEIQFFLDDIKEKNLLNNFVLLVNSVKNGSDIWKNSNGFLRLNSSDMEGLSVKEALELGVPVLASNVCERPSECILVDINNEKELIDKFKFFNDNINSLNEKLRLNPPKINSGFDNILNLYNRLLES